MSVIELQKKINKSSAHLGKLIVVTENDDRPNQLLRWLGQLCLSID